MTKAGGEHFGLSRGGLQPHGQQHTVIHNEKMATNSAPGMASLEREHLGCSLPSAQPSVIGQVYIGGLS
jgi:hypothetical protein